MAVLYNWIVQEMLFGYIAGPFFVLWKTKGVSDLNIAQKLLCAGYITRSILKMTITLSSHFLCCLTLEKTKKDTFLVCRTMILHAEEMTSSKILDYFVRQNNA